MPTKMSADADEPKEPDMTDVSTFEDIAMSADTVRSVIGDLLWGCRAAVRGGVRRARVARGCHSAGLSAISFSTTPICQMPLQTFPRG
jgi:hypothetical protein